MVQVGKKKRKSAAGTSKKDVDGLGSSLRKDSKLKKVLAQYDGELTRLREDFVRDVIKAYPNLDAIELNERILKEATGLIYYEMFHASDSSDRIKAAKEIRKLIPEQHQIGTSPEDMLLAVRAKLGQGGAVPGSASVSEGDNAGVGAASPAPGMRGGKGETSLLVDLSRARAEAVEEDEGESCSKAMESAAGAGVDSDSRPGGGNTMVDV